MFFNGRLLSLPPPLLLPLLLFFSLCDGLGGSWWLLFGILKFFHPPIPHVGESWLEVKNRKNRTRKVVFDPNIFSKIHVFLVITHIEGVIGVRSLAARSVYEGYYRKTWTFQPRFWVENPFGVMIFWIFWFQKNALFMGVLLVLKKISSDILKCVITLNWRSASKHCIWYIIPLKCICVYVTYYYKLMTFQNRVWV